MARATVAVVKEMSECAIKFSRNFHGSEKTVTDVKQ
jgi:hypothetical protein